VTIRSLPFRHGAKPDLGFEIFRLRDLFDRADRREIDHALETPQRPQFHTIYVGLRGKGSLVVDFTPVPLGANTLTIMAAHRVQQFVPDRRVDAWMLLFAPERVPTSPLFSPTWPSPVITLRDRAPFDALVAQLVAEHARSIDAQQPQILDALLRALILHAERLHGETPPPAALERFFTILERDHAKTRSVAHYAKQAGISSRRLGELLGERTGKSTKQVIDERIVLEAKRHLAHTELSVKELAAQLGFDEPTNFVKFFRHHTQTTPQAFREAQRTFLPSGRAS
jgi:AraC family transcriptional regulator, transcriptional activator of pobA